MTEVKSLSITADSYRHRGWVWSDRSIYELLKPHMKLPLWIDRILTNRDGTDLYAVGKTDGYDNTVHLGLIRTANLTVPESFSKQAARYHCRIHPDNGFRVLAERIRAKKPDANKAPRPLWRQPMAKPWEPGTLKGKWVLDSKLVKEVSLNTVVPERADRLYISTSGGTDTLVWADSTTIRSTLGRVGSKVAWAQGVVGIKGYQRADDYSYDTVLLQEGCLWQLAGVRKQTVWVPEPEVVKPEPDVPLTATAVRAAQAEQVFYGTATGHLPYLNPPLTAPYMTRAIYKELAENLGVSRSAAKVRLFRNLYTPQPRGKTIIFDYENLERMLLAYCPADALSTVPKPPIGVKPRNLHDEERANALDEAIARYLNEDLPFPIEWATEWNELRARLNKE